jgi:hypothetical protein
MVDIAQSLTKRIGPFPAWGWGVGVGGGLLAFSVLRGGSLLGGSKTETLPKAASEDGDETSVITTQQGPPGPVGMTGPPGTPAPTAPAKPACTAAGWTPQYDPIKNVWNLYGVYVPRPTTPAPAGKEWFWFPSCTWGHRDIDAGAQGLGSLGTARIIRDGRAAGGFDASLNTRPTIQLGDIGGVQIASPDVTPKSYQRIPRRNQIPMTPAYAGKRPTSLSRQNGRPFHGV